MVTRFIRTALSVGIAIIFALPFEVLAKQYRVTIAVGEMPYLMSANPEQMGAYNKIMAEVGKTLTQKFNIEYLPPGRAGQAFENQDYDCLMPAQMAGMVNKDKRIASKPFNYARAYIFNSPDQAVITSLDALHGKVLATRRGFVYGNVELDDNITRFEVNQISQSIEMLKIKRIDAFIAYEPDILTILKHLPANTVQRSDLVLHEQPEKIVCHLNSTTQQFIDDFNLAIDRLIKSGVINQILADQ